MTCVEKQVVVCRGIECVPLIADIVQAKQKKHVDLFHHPVGKELVVQLSTENALILVNKWMKPDPESKLSMLSRIKRGEYQSHGIDFAVQTRVQSESKPAG